LASEAEGSTLDLAKPGLPLFARFESTSKDSELYLYSLAKRPLVSNRPIEILGEAASPTGELSAAFFAYAASTACQTRADSEALEIYRGDGFIGGNHRPIDCSVVGETEWLQIGDIGLFQVTRDGFTLLQQETDDREELELAILGPTLLLALALGGTFCLHASAAALSQPAGFQPAAQLFLGSSGAGKSTLARHLGSRNRRHIADDLGPVLANTHRVEALPGLPQPKDLRLHLGRELAVRSFYLLEEENDIQVVSLPPAEAALSLMRHTAAARLFPPTLMERHLDAAARWARLTPVSRLSYPRRWDALDAVADLLEADSS